MGQAVTEMSEQAAGAIEDIGTFFDGLDFEVIDIESFDFSAPSLRDLIQFDTGVELTFAMSARYFPGQSFEGVWAPSFEARFNPVSTFNPDAARKPCMYSRAGRETQARVFGDLKDEVLDFAREFLTEQLDLSEVVDAIG